MSDIDLDAAVRDQQERPHQYGPGAVEDLRDRLAAEARRLTESLDAARGVAEYLEDEVSVERTRTIKAEAERDELRATVERICSDPDFDQEFARLRAIVQRVEALANESMSSSCIHVNDLVVDLRAALHPQEPHTPAQDASSGPDGSEGAGAENRPERGVDAFIAAALTAVAGQRFDDDVFAGRCGDRLTTWHGPIGPCVRTGRHDLHDDGAGVTWSRTNVPDLTGEPS